MKFNPIAQIGEKVHIVNAGVIQTSHKFSIVHLASGFNGKKFDYYIHDIKVTLSLLSGEVEYSYLISDRSDSKVNDKWFHGGWVKGNYIKKVEVETDEIASHV